MFPLRNHFTSLNLIYKMEILIPEMTHKTLNMSREDIMSLKNTYKSNI